MNNQMQSSLIYSFRSLLKYFLSIIFIYLFAQITLYYRVYHINNSTVIVTSTYSNQTNHIRLNVSEKICKIVPPQSINIDYNNSYWQRFISSNGTFYLYNAYYDHRPLVGSHPTIRILSMIDRISPPPEVFCRIWFYHSSISIQTKATYHYIWYPKWGQYQDKILQPFLISCSFDENKQLLNKSLQPKSISLFEKTCTNLTNNLPIHNNRLSDEKNSQKDFVAVCVKGLDYLHEDISLRLIEWIELLKILGTNKIFFYQFAVHSNMSKVLQYYHSKDFVHIQPISLPGSQPNSPLIRSQYLKANKGIRRQNELIPYNDCFYRNMNLYRFILLLDIDEIIIPLKHFNWLQMINDLENNPLYTRDKYSAISARNVYFLDKIFPNKLMKMDTLNEIPNYFHMLKHIQRSSIDNITDYYVKTFFDTQRVIALHNHYLMKCFNTCYHYRMNVTFARLQHYRNDCVDELRNSCQNLYRTNTTQDTIIWKYKQRLIDQTSRVAKELHLI